MVSAGDFWGVKTWSHFIDTNTTRVNFENYIKLLNRGLLQTANVYTLTMAFIVQQEGAASHTSHRTQQHLEDAAPAFINKDEWLQQNPDCNLIEILFDQ